MTKRGLALYRDVMTQAELTSRWARATLGALRAPATWRATGNALAGLLAGLAGGLLLGSLAVIWGAAVVSLVAGARRLGARRAVHRGGGDRPGAGAVGGAGARRPAAVAAPGHARGGDPAPVGRPDARRGRSGRGSRPGPGGELGFHLTALITGVAGGLLVAACWLAPVAMAGDLTVGGSPAAGVACAAAVALLLAAPWVARHVSRADEVLARALLGPGRREQLALRVESLARSRADLVAAADAERRRIERDLHDGAQQRLVSLAMNLGMARERFAEAPEPVRQAIAEAHDEALLALSELREFIRGLHPAVLNDRGLDAALSGLAARAPLPVRLRVDVPRPAAPGIEAVAYFIVSEALTNVVKHAQATRAEVTGHAGRRRAAHHRHRRRLRRRRPAAGDGTGLRGLAQRAAAVDGTLTIDSPLGGPTVITAELPCES